MAGDILGARRSHARSAEFSFSHLFSLSHVSDHGRSICRRNETNTLPLVSDEKTSFQSFAGNMALELSLYDLLLVAESSIRAPTRNSNRVCLALGFSVARSCCNLRPTVLGIARVSQEHHMFRRRRATGNERLRPGKENDKSHDVHVCGVLDMFASLVRVLPMHPHVSFVRGVWEMYVFCVTYYFFMSSSLVNPFLYAWSLPKYRSALCKLLLLKGKAANRVRVSPASYNINTA